MSGVLMLLLMIVVLFMLAWHFTPGLMCVWLVKLARVLCAYKVRSIDVDGYKWHYLDSGGEGKEVVLFLHGFGANKDNWLAFGRFFNRRYRVIIPDLPGFGDNAKDTSFTYKIEEQADRLSRFIQQLGLDKVHLTGNSMGGFIAKWFALKYPRQLASVIFMNSAGVQGTKKSWLELHVEQGHNPLVIKDIDEIDGLLARIFHQPPPLPAMIKRFIFADMLANHDFYDSIFWSFFSGEGEMPYLNDRLVNITVPVMVIWGDHDELLDVSCAYVIKDKIPSANLVILQNVGHVPMVEASKLAAEYQLAFLSKLKTPVKD